MAKFLFFSAIAVIILIRIGLFFVDWIAHKIGLLKLIILQRYFNGKISDQDLEEYERNHK